MENSPPQKDWKAKLVGNKSVAENTYELTFEIVEPGFSFTAGQYVWVILPKYDYDDPKGERRAFSICSSPTSGNKISIVFRNSDSSYKKTLLKLPVGEEVHISGPFGKLALPEIQTVPVVIIAGGVGIAPCLSLIRSAFEKKETRNITLFYLNSNENKVAYGDELAEITRKYSSFVMHKVIGKLNWSHLSASISNVASPVWYIIGTETMVTGVAKLLYEHGIDEKNLRFEQFYASKDAFILSIKKMWGAVELFKLAVESSSNHIIFTDLNGTIFFANKGSEQVTGFSNQEMIGQTPRLWGGLMDQEFYKQLWHTIKDEKKPFEAEIQNRRKNGERYLAIARISPILDSGNNLLGFMGTEEDISRRVNLEADLTSKVAELERINKFMVGRELKMRDLKDRVETLKSKIKTQSNTDNQSEDNN